ncbi:hypothetical protein O6H91_11G072800 [Diphasiastrum complanatum]|uniref:Uncharacterized protein n=1 Tax=Diphasiastrum complanatum TaxID=34168 RepID=A0ACC2CAE3_DIPCM|nr:hypothetical protein O6H91_11G072800 [Diphasiastrum complanatum]
MSNFVRSDSQDNWHRADTLFTSMPVHSELKPRKPSGVFTKLKTNLGLNKELSPIKLILSKWATRSPVLPRLQQSFRMYSRSERPVSSLKYSWNRRRYRRIESQIPYNGFQRKKRTVLRLGNKRTLFRKIQIRSRVKRSLLFLKKVKDAYIQMLASSSAHGFATGLLLPRFWYLPPVIM